MVIILSMSSGYQLIYHPIILFIELQLNIIFWKLIITSILDDEKFVPNINSQEYSWDNSFVIISSNH